MQQADWIRLFPFPVHPYPQHRALLAQITPLWQKRQNIDEFIRAVLNNSDEPFVG